MCSATVSNHLSDNCRLIASLPPVENKSCPWRRALKQNCEQLKHSCTRVTYPENPASPHFSQCWESFDGTTLGTTTKVLRSVSEDKFSENFAPTWRCAHNLESRKPNLPKSVDFDEKPTINPKPSDWTEMLMSRTNVDYHSGNQTRVWIKKWQDIFHHFNKTSPIHTHDSYNG